MKRLFSIYILFILIATGKICTAQKNFCHLAYELSSTNAVSLDSFAKHIDSNSFSKYSDVVTLKEKVAKEFLGVKNVTISFKRNYLDSASGKKFTIAYATIGIASFDISNKTLPKGKMIPHWIGNPIVDTITKYYDQTLNYLSKSCFTDQLTTPVLRNDDKIGLGAKRISCYLYSPNLGKAENLNMVQYNTLFKHVPHMELMVQQHLLDPICNLQIELVWASEQK